MTPKLPKKVEALKHLFDDVYYFAHIGLDEITEPPEQTLKKYQALMKPYQRLFPEGVYSCCWPEWPLVKPITIFGMSFENSLDAMASFVQHVLHRPSDILNPEDNPQHFQKKLAEFIKFDGWEKDNDFYHETSKIINHYNFEVQLYLEQQAGLDVQSRKGQAGLTSQDFRKRIAREVDMILIEYPRGLAIFREQAKQFCDEYQACLDKRQEIDPVVISDEKFNTIINELDLPIDETALKSIPRNPIRSGEYFKRVTTLKERLPEQYIALAVLHDNILTNDPAILIDKSLACQLVKKIINSNKIEYDETFCEIALKAVRADLNARIERIKFYDQLKKDARQSLKRLKGPNGKTGGAETKTGFKVSKGQIHYNGKEISISMGQQYEILKKLAEKIGEVISYAELDSQSGANASEQLRTDISEIRKSLKTAEIPFTINSKRTEGYILVSK